MTKMNTAKKLEQLLKKAIETIGMDKHLPQIEKGEINVSEVIELVSQLSPTDRAILLEAFSNAKGNSATTAPLSYRTDGELTGDVTPDKRTHIGKIEIHPEQRQAAAKIMAAFLRGEHPLLIAQMQQGKTNTVIAAIDLFIQKWKASGVKLEIIFLNNISDRSLKDQALKRITQAGMAKNVIVIHHAEINKFQVDTTVVKRLIVVDECHFALGKNKPFHMFLKKLGIQYGENPATWTNKDTYVLSVSATPFASVIKSKIEELAFSPIVLKVNSNYHSLKHMLNVGRLFPSDHVVNSKGEITPFFHDRMKEFGWLTKNKPGYMIVRCQGENPAILVEYVNARFPHVDVKIIESVPVNNIAQLEPMLAEEPANPMVVIIKGCLRAGKTLSTTKHIRMCIEPSRAKTDSMLQSLVGRCCGYEMIGKGNAKRNRRFDDKFPIYCNIEEVKNAVKFFDGVGSGGVYAIPSGRFNSSTTQIVDNVQVIAFSTEKEAKKAIPGAYIGRCSNWGVASASNNDMAKIVLDKNIKALPGVDKSGKKNRVLFIDKPNPRFQDSWNLLMQAHPEYKKKFLVMKKVGERHETNYHGRLSPGTCLFN